jgi:hypothetical protein
MDALADDVATCPAARQIRRAVPDNPQNASARGVLGTVIWMYRPDHPPHFYARYGDHAAQIKIDGLRVLNGSLPPRALRLVREWAGMHHEELTANWELAQELEPLVPIDPLA